jgi:ribosomal protein S26
MKKIFSLVSAIIALQVLNCSVWAQTASVTCPGNRTVATDAGSCIAIVNNIDPIASPAGAVVNYTVSNGGMLENGYGSASGRSFSSGNNLVTYFLPDYPGVSCNFTITVQDHTPPVITCPQNITVKCAKEIPPIGNVTATDGCTASSSIDIKFLGEVISNQTCIDRYILTRTYKATDAAGNSSTCAQIITVYDDEAPHFLQPPPISPVRVSCPSNVPVVFPDQYTAYDECQDEDVYVQFKQVKTNGSCDNKYTLTRTWTATDGCGNSTVYTQIINVDDTEAPVFNHPPPSSISVNCAADIPEAAVLTADDNCAGVIDAPTVTFKEVKSNEQCVNKFKLTRTWTATDICGNTSTYTQVITVNDTQAPVFDGSQPSSPITVSCEKDIPAAGTQTATDNCGNATVQLTEVKSNVQCANRFTLTRTWIATDACGNSTTRTQVINVYDNEPPKITAVSADPVVLWPPNHKMRDVTINYTATDNCGVTGSLSVSSSDPVSGGSDGDQSPDWEVIDAHHVRLRAEKANNGQARYYDIRITITDGCNASVDTTITVVVAHNITSPQTGNSYKIGSTVSLNGLFWDKAGNTHTAKWLLDGASAANGNVTEPSGKQNGKVTGSYKFNAAGVYKLQMNVTDQSGITSYANTCNDLDAIVVVYDPNGGNAYGGGWFPSQAGALTSDPSAEGKASYGFSVNYKNAAKPKGETQFEFKVGSFEFNALNFDYLSINGAIAQFKGTGKIVGGQSGIGFIMTVKDGTIDESDMDMIRMKIYNRNTGYVYYDNQPDASDADEPVTIVGTNSSIVIYSTGSVSSAVTTEIQNEDQHLIDKLKLLVYPNPSNNKFSLEIKTNDLKTPVQLRVFDQTGRLIDGRENAIPGSFIQLGEKYKTGIYYVRVIQGARHSTSKLVKVSE